MDIYITSFLFGIVTSVFTSYLFKQVISLKNIYIALIDVTILSSLGYLFITQSSILSIIVLVFLAIYLFYIKNCYYYKVFLNKKNPYLSTLVSNLISEKVAVYETPLPSIPNIVKIKNKVFISSTLIKKIDAEKLSIIVSTKLNSEKNISIFIIGTLYFIASMTFYVGAKSSSNKYLYFMGGGLLIGLVKVINENYKNKPFIQIHNIEEIIAKRDDKTFINAVNGYIEILKKYPTYKKESLVFQKLVYEIQKK